jgi:hypothetical protein
LALGGVGVARADGEPIPSTAETLVYIVVTMYLIAVTLAFFGLSAHPLPVTLVAMGVVYCSLAYDLPARAEYQLGRLVGRLIADAGVDHEE